MAIKSPLLIQREEHDETLLAKKVSIVSGATIYAVVNSGTGGTSSTDDAVFNVGVDSGTPFMALADETSPDQVNEGDVGVPRMTLNRILYTQGFSSATIFAVVNTAAVGQSSIVLDRGHNFIGLATVVMSSSVTVGNLVSAATLFAVVNTAAQGQASVVLDNSISSIGFATVNVVNLARTITGNVTLSDAKTYIGLTTTTLGLGSATIGLVRSLQETSPWVVSAIDLDIRDLNATTDDVAITGNVTLSDSKGFIGLVSVSGFANPLPVTWAGNVTLDDGSLTGIVGNVTLSDAKTFIGLVTNVPDYGSNVTIHTAVYSATGNNTLFVAPASNRFWLTNLHISSLGRAEVEIRSGATTLIPFTALATTGGYVHNFEMPGLPSRAQADSLVVNLNGSATVAVLASWYSRP